MGGWNQKFQQGEDEKSEAGLSKGQVCGSCTTLSISRYLLLCNLFETYGSFCKRYYSIVIKTFHLINILLLYVWFEHPRHTYGGFGSTLLEPGYDLTCLSIEEDCG
jgi:hypothetical protein